MRGVSSALGLLLGLLVVTSCTREEPREAEADSATTEAVDTEPVDESLDAMPVVQQSQESRIGSMDLLGDPQSGTCTSEGDPAVATRYTYEGDWPPRTVRLEVADASRGAALRMFEVQSTRRPGEYDETEAIYVLFDATGGIQQGSRRYFSSETPPTREQGPLAATDTAQVLQLAQLVLDWCRRPAGAR
jgi:hypothetical protein